MTHLNTALTISAPDSSLFVRASAPSPLPVASTRQLDSPLSDRLANFLQNHGMRQRYNERLLCESDTQLALETSNDELGLVALASGEEFFDDTDLFLL